MKASKTNICKYPKCSKEVRSDASLFCIEHSRNLKNNFETVSNVMNKAMLAAAVIGIKGLMKKKE